MGLLTGPQLWAFAASCREAPGGGPGPARTTAGGRDGGQLVRAGAGVRLARPPAVAVFGLRRSGRTGNGEVPQARRARLPDWALSSHPHVDARRARDHPSSQAPGALRAPLKIVMKVLTRSTLCILCASTLCIYICALALDLLGRFEPRSAA